MRITSPLTDFLIALQDAPSERLLKADIAKLADRWSVNVDHAAGYLRLELENRGHGSKLTQAPHGG